MSGTRRAAVIGATGAVGASLLAQLAADDRYATVRVFARRPAPDDDASDWRVVDFEALPEGLDLNGIDELYCCLGTTMKSAGSREQFRRVDHDYVVAAGRTAAQAGVGHMLVVSAVGADPRSPVFYNRTKGQMEQALAALELTAVDIVRPSLLLGPRVESRPGEALGKAIAPLFSTLLLGPLRRYRPIQAADVATAMIQLARQRGSGFRVHHLPLSTTR